ncbi:hypothetical protein [uncultured Dokdonia sp.]|uniref:hypothetical protein n=1 Tax=uncultured Dokdonia sp. TaxID=575653 RepID=UPI002617B605|nr:hypothetical protein [uncultured Dokdonia sp.]
MTTTNKPNIAFWIIAIVLGLLWNLMGVSAFYLDNFGGEEILASMYTEEQLEYIKGIASWEIVLYGVATIGGLIAAIAMLMRKKIAALLFLISTLAVVFTTAYGLTATNHLEVFGTMQSIYFPIMIIIIGFFLYWYCKRSTSKGWLS